MKNPAIIKRAQALLRISRSVNVLNPGRYLLGKQIRKELHAHK